MPNSEHFPFDGLSPEPRELTRPPKSWLETETARLMEAARVAGPVVQYRGAALAEIEAMTRPRSAQEMFSMGRYTEDPFKAFQDSQKAVADQLRAALNPPLSVSTMDYMFKGYREAQERVAEQVRGALGPDPLKAYRDAERKMADQFRAVFNPPAIKPVWEDPFKAQMEAMNKQMREVGTAFRESLQSLRLPDIAEQYKLAQHQQNDAIAETFRRVQEAAALSPSIRELLEAIDTSSLAVDAAAAELASDGATSQEEQEDAAAAFAQLVKDAGGEPTVVGLLTQILAAIQAQKDSRLQKLWWLGVYPLLLALWMSVINSYVDFHVKHRLERTKSPQEATKVVKQEARKAVDDPRELSDFRFVSVASGKSLAVRRAAGARAPMVGQLRFGQAVYLIEKGKDFSLVEWRSEDGSAVLRGWVFSRYLQRFT